MLIKTKKLGDVKWINGTTPVSTEDSVINYNPMENRIEL